MRASRAAALACASVCGLDAAGGALLWAGARWGSWEAGAAGGALVACAVAVACLAGIAFASGWLGDRPW